MTPPDNAREAIEALLSKSRYDFEDLIAIMTLLRSEQGCSWDREQTHQSIRNCFIEEVYEAVEAIDGEDPVLLREELGDVLFQVVFHAQIEAEAARFTVEDVVHDICVKMIHRHPHVFASEEGVKPEDALARWEAIKIEEKQRRTLSSRLRAIPVILPALMRAEKVAGKLGLSKEDKQEGLLSDIQQKVTELENVTPDERDKRTGELLFSIVLWAASHGVSAEKALGDVLEQVIRNVEWQET